MLLPILKFVLSLHSPFAFCVGPNILLSIFLSNNSVVKYVTNKLHSDCYFVITRLRDLQVSKNDMLHSGTLHPSGVEKLRVLQYVKTCL